MRLTPGERLALRRGRQGVERGDAPGALPDLQTLVAERPGFADAHYWLALAHEQQGELPEAAGCLEEALRLNPGYVEARLALACVYEQQGEWAEARRLSLETPRVASPGRGRLDATTLGKLANLHASLGDAYREVGELSEAIDAYRKALDHGPRFHDLRLRLAVTLRDAGLPRQALSELDRILRADPTQLGARVQQGVTLWSIGRQQEACTAWREALARDPELADAQAYLRMAEGTQGDDAA